MAPRLWTRPPRRRRMQPPPPRARRFRMSASAPPSCSAENARARTRAQAASRSAACGAVAALGRRRPQPQRARRARRLAALRRRRAGSRRCRRARDASRAHAAAARFRIRDAAMPVHARASFQTRRLGGFRLQMAHARRTTAARARAARPSAGRAAQARPPPPRDARAQAAAISRSARAPPRQTTRRARSRRARCPPRRCALKHNARVAEHRSRPRRCRAGAIGKSARLRRAATREVLAAGLGLSARAWRATSPPSASAAVGRLMRAPRSATVRAAAASKSLRRREAATRFTRKLQRLDHWGAATRASFEPTPRPPAASGEPRSPPRATSPAAAASLARAPGGRSKARAARGRRTRPPDCRGNRARPRAAAAAERSLARLLHAPPLAGTVAAHPEQAAERRAAPLPPTSTRGPRAPSPPTRRRRAPPPPARAAPVQPVRVRRRPRERAAPRRIVRRENHWQTQPPRARARFRLVRCGRPPPPPGAAAAASALAAACLRAHSPAGDPSPERGFEFGARFPAARRRRRRCEATRAPRRALAPARLRRRRSLANTRRTGTWSETFDLVPFWLRAPRVLGRRLSSNLGFFAQPGRSSNARNARDRLASAHSRRRGRARATLVPRALLRRSARRYASRALCIATNSASSANFPVSFQIAASLRRVLADGGLGAVRAVAQFVPNIRARLRARVEARTGGANEGRLLGERRPRLLEHRRFRFSVSPCRRSLVEQRVSAARACIFRAGVAHAAAGGVTRSRRADARRRGGGSLRCGRLWRNRCRAPRRCRAAAVARSAGATAAAKAATTSSRVGDRLRRLRARRTPRRCSDSVAPPRGHRGEGPRSACVTKPGSDACGASRAACKAAAFSLRRSWISRSSPPNASGFVRHPARRAAAALCSRTRAPNSRRARPPRTRASRRADLPSPAPRSRGVGERPRRVPTWSEGSHETSPRAGRARRGRAGMRRRRFGSARRRWRLRASSSPPQPSRSSAAASAVKSMRRGRVETRVSGRVSAKREHAVGAESAESVGGGAPSAPPPRRAPRLLGALEPPPPRRRRRARARRRRRARARALDAGARQRARFRRIPERKRSRRARRGVLGAVVAAAPAETRARAAAAGLRARRPATDGSRRCRPRPHAAWRARACPPAGTPRARATPARTGPAPRRAAARARPASANRRSPSDHSRARSSRVFDARRSARRGSTERANATAASARRESRACSRQIEVDTCPFRTPRAEPPPGRAISASRAAAHALSRPVRARRARARSRARRADGGANHAAAASTRSPAATSAIVLRARLGPFAAARSRTPPRRATAAMNAS